MSDAKETIEALYGQRLRLRVCGLMIEGDRLLLVRHKHLGPSGQLWAPPGGGLDFGESIEAALKREFLEETGLSIRPLSLAFTHEFLDPPLHAVELFFWVEKIGGTLRPGSDPEMAGDPQLIEAVSFLSWPEIQSLGTDSLHGGLHGLGSLEALRERRGLWRNGRPVLPEG